MNHEQPKQSAETSESASGGSEWDALAEAPTGLDQEQGAESGEEFDDSPEDTGEADGGEEGGGEDVEQAESEDETNSETEAETETETEDKPEAEDEPESEDDEPKADGPRHAKNGHQSETQISVAELQARLKAEANGVDAAEDADEVAADAVEATEDGAEDSADDEATDESSETEDTEEGADKEDKDDPEAYDQKVKVLTEALKEQEAGDLKRQRETFMMRSNGRESIIRGESAGSLRKFEMQRSYGELSQLLNENSDSVDKPPEERDQFDKITADLAYDLKGTSHDEQLQRAPDAPDFSTHGGLEELVGSDQLKDPDVLDRATTSLRMLTAAGLYKMQKYGNPDQINTALSLVEKYTESVPDFDPKAAGFDEAKRSLTRLAAHTQIEEGVRATSRPSKELDAMPDRSLLKQTALNGLATLRRTEAHHFMRHNGGKIQLTQEEKMAHESYEARRDRLNQEQRAEDEERRATREARRAAVERRNDEMMARSRRRAMA